MKTTTILMMILLSATMISCKHANKYNDKLSYPYSKEETEQFLDEIIQNATAYIGDITEIERQPTDELYIITVGGLAFGRGNAKARTGDKLSNSRKTFREHTLSLRNNKNPSLDFYFCCIKVKT